MSTKSKLLMLASVVIVTTLAYYQLRTPVATTTTDPVPPGAALAKVIVPTLSGNAILGETAFNAKCAVCHGKNAAGQNGVAPPLVHPFYRVGHHNDAAIVRAARNGVRSHHWTFGDMPPVQGLTMGELKSIIVYIRVLQRANGIN